MINKEYYIRACKWCSINFPKLASKDVKVTDELKESLKFLEWGIEPFEVIIFSRFLLILSAIFVFILNLLLFVYYQHSIVIISISCIAPFVISHAITEFPKKEANFERIEALGHAPTILTQIVIYLKQNPNLERALSFVSKYSSGRITKDIRKLLWKCIIGHKIGIKRGLNELAQKWGNYLIELKRSLYLIITSVSEKNEEKRNQTLDRAVNISLEGIVNKVKEYTDKLYLPTLFLFSFGTVLPLVIISLLPIFSFIGKELSSPIQMFLILIVSLAGIYFYSNKILEKRPPSFSSIVLPENLESYPKSGDLKLKFGKKEFEVNAFLYCFLVFIVISFPGLVYLLSETKVITFVPNIFSNILKGFNTLTIIWGLGISIVIYSYGSSWYKKKLRDDIEKLEKSAIDGIYQIASRIDEGRSPEDTIKYIGKNMQNEFGKLMRNTYKILRSRHTTLEESFFGENGSLRNIYSKNLKLIIRIFLISLKKGVKSCANILYTISDHYDKLNKAEERLKSMLRNALSMMRTTASIFAPMITGLVIALQQLIQEGIRSAKEGLEGLGYQYLSLPFLEAPNISVEILQLIAGVYMLLLAYLLIRYASFLEYGKDEIMLKQEIAKNIPISLFIFTFTLIVSRLVLG